MTCAPSYAHPYGRYHTYEIPKAVEVYERGLVYSPNSGSLMNNLGVAYGKMGDYEMSEYMRNLVPLAQADWGAQSDAVMDWALQEKARLQAVLVPPNVPDAELSPSQRRLGSLCWQKPGYSKISCLVRLGCGRRSESPA
jgi:hypothetical protein